MNNAHRFSFFYFILILFCSCLSGGALSLHSDRILPGANSTEEYISKIKYKRIGIVANHASTVGNSNLIDTLIALKIKVVRIFAPEHGFSGKSDAGAIVGNQLYGNTTIPVSSLYGKTKKPLKKDLSEIDMMVFDLQDVGVRFYTYISTLHYVMEACAEANIPLLLLDRPNPNGYFVDGPVLDTGFKSFVGMHPVPIVYGLTIGEYAKMINGEKWLDNGIFCNLAIIKCRNYTHNSFYEIPVSPSPNLTNVKAVNLYPSTALFEGTVVSEGRGTEAPFLIFGHPDFHDHSFSFIPEAKPGASINPKLKGNTCYGFDLRNVSVYKIRELKQINLTYLFTFYNDLQLGDKFFTPFFDKLAGSDKLRKMILEGKSEKQIRESWQAGIENYKKIRAKYLLYPDND